MKWDLYCAQYRDLVQIKHNQQRGEVLRLWVPEVVRHFLAASSADLSWFIRALNHEQCKGFALFVLLNSPVVPEIFFYPLTRTIIDNPTDDGYSVKASVHAFGLQRTTDELYRWEDYGSEEEAKAARTGLYWLQMLFQAKLRKPFL